MSSKLDVIAAIRFYGKSVFRKWNIYANQVILMITIHRLYPIHAVDKIVSDKTMGGMF